MARPRLLDLFSGAGGAAMGYHRAGFDVIGVDIKPQPHYPFPFIRADVMTTDWAGFDAIHASPPCQPFTRAGHLMRAQGGSTSEPDLVEPIRQRLIASGLPYVIENVEGAPIEGVFLCGSSFGLEARRHRLFESNHLLLGVHCQHREQGRPIGVYGRPGDEVPQGGRTAKDVPEAQRALGIDWMPRWEELKQAIPPAYTEHIGRQLIQAIGGTDAHPQRDASEAISHDPSSIEC